jgi:hypothetical protein
MAVTVEPPLAITALVANRARQLRLSPAKLVRRAGYTNEAKGLRRLKDLLAGETRHTRGLIRGLAAALETSTDVVEAAVVETERQLAEAEEAAYRAAFVPHAIILTERLIPQPIFVAAFFGVGRLLKIELDARAGVETFAAQARQGLRERLAAFDGRAIPAFGRPTGFVVNYTPDHAVEYDADGREIAVIAAARRLGTATFSLSGRTLTDVQLRALFAPDARGSGSGDFAR